MVKIFKQIDPDNRQKPESWEMTRQAAPKLFEQSMLQIRFANYPGTGGYVYVGIYSGGQSLDRNNICRNGLNRCPSCEGSAFVSASGVSEGVCLDCESVIATSANTAIRAEQMYWACKEAGIVDAWNMKFVPGKSTSYFVV